MSSRPPRLESTDFWPTGSLTAVHRCNQLCVFALQPSCLVFSVEGTFLEGTTARTDPCARPLNQATSDGRHSFINAAPTPQKCALLPCGHVDFKSTVKAGLHVRHKHKHEHKLRVNRKNASTSASIRKRNEPLFLVLALVLTWFTRGLCSCLCLCLCLPITQNDEFK